jgi:hypothetical protein
MMQGGGEALPLVHAPALEELHRRQRERPAWQDNYPLAVDPELWRKAQVEFRDILARRGWSLIDDINMTRKGIKNFLFYGVAIVMDDA